MTGAIEFVNLSSAKLPRAYLTDFFAFCLPRLRRTKGLRNRELLGSSCLFVFVEPNKARSLNRQFRQKNYTPDVLSFTMGGGLGEVVLCPDIIKKRAQEIGWPLRDYLAYLSLHGLLHLLGYDHELSTKEEKIMFALQDSLWEKWTLARSARERSQYVYRIRNL